MASYSYRGYAPAPTHCQHCGDPIEQPAYGGRTRLYCDRAGCRKAASRAGQKEREQQRLEQLTQRLQTHWRERYSEAAQAKLDALLTTCGPDAAQLAVDALELESTRQSQAKVNAILMQVVDQYVKPMS